MDAKTGNDDVNVLKEDIAKLREDVARLASAVLDAANDKIDDARAEVGRKSQDTADELAGRVSEGIDRGKRFLDDLDAQISRHPVGSTLIAFGAGLLIAKLLGSGDRR